MDGQDHWRPDGTFLRLFSIPNEKGWGRPRIYCEGCLERMAGMTPNVFPWSRRPANRMLRDVELGPEFHRIKSDN